jgi:hypothetical protein
MKLVPPPAFGHVAQGVEVGAISLPVRDEASLENYIVHAMLKATKELTLPTTTTRRRMPASRGLSLLDREKLDLKSSIPGGQGV